VLIEDRRKLYPILSESPILVAGYGGNVSPEVVGLARFEKYILPHYNELAEMLHESGKMLSVHFDANTRVFASAIAKSEIDIIEAFTPSPDCDMSVAEAREAWPDKVLWINFPSAVHLQEPSLIEETTRQILREAAPGNRFLFGITETVPVNKWQQSFSAISRVINAEGRLPL
jgi:EAL domain-containing protein (putative c-di-GMP-specific phosphodiesterase class I)